MLPRRQDQTRWTGNMIISAADNDNKSAVAVPATIKTWNTAGSTQVSDINSSDITPLKPTYLSEYTLLKYQQPKPIKALFNLSTGYYLVILFLAIISLVLNIFVEIKKQHPQIIASSLGLIALLLVLIIL
jgi:hypothetical protein